MEEVAEEHFIVSQTLFDEYSELVVSTFLTNPECREYDWHFVLWLVMDQYDREDLDNLFTTDKFFIDGIENTVVPALRQALQTV